jgi:hypothetical protein
MRALPESGQETVGSMYQMRGTREETKSLMECKSNCAIIATDEVQLDG